MGRYFSLAVHGGAGTIVHSLMTDELEREYVTGLRRALGAGRIILENSGSALDAVTAAVIELEDCPLFNAGKGSVFNHKGKHEMDACIMEGSQMLTGSVAGIHNIKNPILLARSVMEKSVHILLAGEGAMEFAQDHGFELMPDDYFFTQERYNQWQAIKNTDIYLLDHTGVNKGTVGAVACDMQGNLAAATSTGGMTNKQYGRIGDSPLPGAGTYANNATCAVSCTGHGEFFMVGVVAYDVSCLIEYAGMSLQEACEKVILDKQVKLGGEGGLIATDQKGNVSMVFNSEGMYRGSVRSGEEMQTAIFR